MDGPHMLDVASLTQPIAADDPCGPDLDAIGDVQYLNFFAGAESLLPMSFFEVVNANGERGRFDPKAVDFAGQFAAAQPILARTRDLRLNLLLAKFSILNRDLDGFLCCLKATNLLLREQWEAVHPKGEDGDYALRAVTVEAIDVFPTVINPLQFLPLIENADTATSTTVPIKSLTEKFPPATPTPTGLIWQPSSASSARQISTLSRQPAGGALRSRLKSRVSSRPGTRS